MNTTRKHSIETLARFSNIRENQAGERVAGTRNALEGAERRVDMLGAYRRQIARQVEAEVMFGQALHALAAFDTVTRVAEQQARSQRIALRSELAEAIDAWAGCRNEGQVLHKKYADAVRTERHDIELAQERLAPPAGVAK
ncbi:MAG TPA: hypothetical protein VF292_09435 [Rhodanobacteraceae bacterium]